MNIWTHHGKPVASVKEHTEIVKGAAWIDRADPSKGFISVSHDQTAILWGWEEGTDKLSPKITLRGHERGIDSVDVSKNSHLLATGG